MILYKTGNNLLVEEVVELYNNSGLGVRRPVGDKNKMKGMLANANLVISAWDNKIIVGIARALSDFSYITYLSDIAVRKEYQRKGIGKELINQLKKAAGTKIVLLSAPDAEQYYPKIGFHKHNSAWVLSFEGK